MDYINICFHFLLFFCAFLRTEEGMVDLVDGGEA